MRLHPAPGEGAEPAGLRTGGRRSPGVAAPAALGRLDAGGAARLLGFLQGAGGNAAVQRLVASATVQRDCGCGGTCGCGAGGGAVHDGEEPGDVVVARQTPPVVGKAPLQAVIDALDSGAPTALDDAFFVLNGRAMPELLTVLSGLQTAGRFSVVKANAGRGGPRMDVACKVVELRAAGTPSHDDLRRVVDMVETFPPDQRTAIFRFLGANLVVDVRGVDVDVSYCKGATGAGCEKAIREAIAWARKMAAEYAACRGRKGIRTGDDVENCVDASLGKQGITTSQAGGTSSTGAVTVAAQPMTKCEPIMTRGTEIHEGVHQAHTLALRKKFGAGTPQFQAAWNNAADWISDEINAYGAEIPFYQEVLKAMKTVCKTVS